MPRSSAGYTPGCKATLISPLLRGNLSARSNATQVQGLGAGRGTLVVQGQFTAQMVILCVTQGEEPHLWPSVLSPLHQGYDPPIQFACMVSLELGMALPVALRNIPVQPICTNRSCCIGNSNAGMCDNAYREKVRPELTVSPPKLTVTVTNLSSFVPSLPGTFASL